MCDPTGGIATSLIITAISTAASMKAQHDQASDQARYQESLDAESSKVANRQLAQLAIRQSQENEAVAIEAIRADRESNRSVSTARVALAESGVAGNAASQILSDFVAQNGMYTAALDRQLKITTSDLRDKQESIRTQLGYDKTRAAAPIQGPNYAGALATLGGAAVNAHEMGERRKG